MVDNLDFGQDNESPGKQNALTPQALTFSADGTTQTIHLLSGDTLSCGRNSEHDICLRVHPTSDEENARKTGMISREHFRLGHQDGVITIEDLQSTRGTKLADKALSATEPTQISPGDQIDVGGVLQLRAKTCPSSSDPSNIGCCLVSRLNNLPNEAYLWLIHDAKISSKDDAAIQVVKRPSSSLGLDFGGSSSSDCTVSLHWTDKGELTVECHSKHVKLNSDPLQEGDTTVVTVNDELVVGVTVFTFS